MTATRRGVFEALAAATEAGDPRTVTARDLGVDLAADEDDVRSHLRAVAACELAVRKPGAGFRVSAAGEELLALDADGPVIVDPRPGSTRPASR